MKSRERDVDDLAPPNRLSSRERLAAIFAAGLALAFSGLVLYLPPEVKEAGGEQCQSAQECGVIEVSADTESVAVALLVISGASLAVGLLGIRFTRLSAGGYAIEAAVGEVAREPGRGKAVTGLRRRAMAGPVDPERSEREWERLPTWARAALSGWAEAGDVLTRQPRRSILSAEQEGKRRAWLVAVELDDGSRSTLRLTYGRGSSRVAPDSD
jgi:hypothetical protein